MSKDLLIKGQMLSAQTKGMLAAEQFVNDNYLLRRNVLSGKVEFAKKPADGESPTFRPLTSYAVNSIILEAKRRDICEGKNPKSDITITKKLAIFADCTHILRFFSNFL